MKQLNYKYSGFTLVETLLVIILILILAGGMLVVIRPNQRFSMARNNQRRLDIQKIESAINQYRLQEGSYPAGLTPYYREVCNTGSELVGGPTNCQGRLDLRVLVPTYLESIPADSKAQGPSSGYVILTNPQTNILQMEANLAELGQLIATRQDYNPYILNQVPNASVAYSVRKLRREYTGPAIRVRRSSDNAQQDIGFAGQDIDILSLLSFVGSAYDQFGSVSVWYDQTGNGKNLVEPSLNRGPTIIDEWGATELIGNKLAINFHGTIYGGKRLQHTLSTEVGSVYTTLRSATISFPADYIILDATTDSDRIGGIAQGGDTGFDATVFPSQVWRNGTTQTIGTSGTLAPITDSMLVTFVKNVSKSNNLPGIRVGPISASLGSQYMSEIIAYPTDNTATARAQIETDLNRYYNLY